MAPLLSVIGYALTVVMNGLPQTTQITCVMFVNPIIVLIVKMNLKMNIITVRKVLCAIILSPLAIVVIFGTTVIWLLSAFDDDNTWMKTFENMWLRGD